jgi:site-specific recombinase XerD
MSPRRPISEGVKMQTLSEALRVFLIEKEVSGRSQATLGFYKGKIEMFVAFVGDKPVKDLTLQDGQNWVLHLRSRHKYSNHPNRLEMQETMTTSTLRGYVRAIKVFASYLNEEGYTRENVFAKLKLPKDTQRVMEILSEEEIRRIYDAIEPGTMRGARMFATVNLLCDTGMRVGELQGIKLDDIDFRQSRVKITGKGDKERVVPFGVTTSKALLAWINRYRPETFDKSVFLMSRQAIIAAMKRLGERSGVPRLHNHLWRHTFAVRWLRNGGNVFSLQQVLGHSDLSVTKVYMHLAQVDLDNQHRLVSPVDRLGIGKKLRK